MSSVIDEAVDEPIQAIADLLEKSIVAKFGRAALADKATFTHLITVTQLKNRLPALIVFREGDRADADHDYIDNEVVTVVIEYYLPATTPDRMKARTAFLRKVWKHVHARLRAGMCPLVEPVTVNRAAPDKPADFVPALAMHGWLVPMLPPATVKYSIATGETDPIPFFRAVVTMRTTAQFDWTFDGDYEHDDLLEMRSTVTHEPADPDDDPEPAYESRTAFPPRT